MVKAYRFKFGIPGNEQVCIWVPSYKLYFDTFCSEWCYEETQQNHQEAELIDIDIKYIEKITHIITLKAKIREYEGEINQTRRDIEKIGDAFGKVKYYN